MNELLYEPWNPWVWEPLPWMTTDLRYRADMMERRRAATWAIIGWSNADPLLQSDALRQLDELDLEREAWIREADTLAGAWASWP